jgi:hypothetical protein
MKNITMQMFAEFVVKNYDMLKKEYNKLSSHEKSLIPMTIFCVKTFDVLLTEMQKENEKLANESTTPTQVESDL